MCGGGMVNDASSADSKKKRRRRVKRRNTLWRPPACRIPLSILLPLFFYFLVLQTILEHELGKHIHNNPIIQSLSRNDDIFSFSHSNQRHSGNLSIDTLSIGTLHNLKLLETQSQTWATHSAIRYFFAATEHDDVDPTCATSINITDVKNIRRKCQKEQPFIKDGPLKSHVKGFSKHYLDRGSGWVCAQQRFAAAIEKLGRFYRNQLLDDGALPDFLLIQDDDTYFNMVLMEEFLRDLTSSTTKPIAEAPCLVQHTKGWNFSFPWGGFGFIVNKAALKNWIRPIYCQEGSSDGLDTRVCARLAQDLLGEARFFQEGMSVSDLMGAHARHNLFRNYDSPEWSYCLHGDWALGYYVNYYYISSHVDNGFADVPEFRIESHLGGIFTGHWGDCRYRRVDKCDEMAHVCHKQTVESMINQTQHVAAKFPGAFNENAWRN